MSFSPPPRPGHANGGDTGERITHILTFGSAISSAPLGNVTRSLSPPRAPTLAVNGLKAAPAVFVGVPDPADSKGVPQQQQPADRRVC